MTSSQAAVVVAGMSAGYGDLEVVRNASLFVGDRELVGLIGPNGSGKSTLLYGLAGAVWCRARVLELYGQDLARVEAWRRARQGLRLAHQSQGIFRFLTVEQNLRMAGSEPRRLEIIFEGYEHLRALAVTLRQRSGQVAGTLSGGEQRILSVGMALAADPVVLLMDEPTLGLFPEASEEMLDLIARTIEEGRARSVLVVSHDRAWVHQNCTRVYEMENGYVKEAAGSLISPPAVS